MSKYWYNEGSDTRFISIDNKHYVPFVDKHLKCSRCGNTVYRDSYKWVSQCKVCRNIINFFAPTPIQTVASVCEASILFNIGGYGSGKTTISSFIISTMARRIPGSRTICLAQTLQQLEKNAISELKLFFTDEELLKTNKDYWELTNGSVIEFWPSDDPDKLKSANANFIWIVEGNNYKMEGMFNEALARIRNDKGFIYARDENGDVIYEKVANGQTKPKILDSMNMIIVEANPDDNSWTNNSVYKAHTIIHTPSVKGMEIIKQRAKPLRVFDDFTNKETNTDVVAILNATIDNPVLPSSYFINLHQRCSTQEEYDKIVYCDITSKEGLVFKDLVDNPGKYFIDYQQTPMLDRDWVFIEGLDPGGANVRNDPEAYLLMLFNKRTKQAIVIDGHKVAGLTLSESTKRIWLTRDKWNWNRDRYLGFVADNALGKNDKISHNHSLKNEYEIRLTTGITLQNTKGIDYGIKLVNQWISMGALKFSHNVDFLRRELSMYSTHPQKKILKNGEMKTVQVYSENENHAIDTLRYMIVYLESIGYRQDSSMIEVNRGNYPSERVDLHLERKDSVRRFLPDFSKPYEAPTERKILKY